MAPSFSSPGTAAVCTKDYEFVNRALRPLAWAYWIMISCNVITPQLFWFKKIQTSMTWDIHLVHFCQHRDVVRAFVAITVTLHRDFTPSAWGYYVPTIFDILTFVGSFGLFFTLFILFLKFLPAIAIAEVKGAVTPQADPHWEGYHKDHKEEASHG